MFPLTRKFGYQDVYPGIDLVYYGNQRQLEYDLVVAPGADPAEIKLAFEGAKILEVSLGGNLWVGDGSEGTVCVPLGGANIAGGTMCVIKGGGKLAAGATR